MTGPCRRSALHSPAGQWMGVAAAEMAKSVEDSRLSARRTLAKLGIPRSAVSYETICAQARGNASVTGDIERYMGFSNEKWVSIRSLHERPFRFLTARSDPVFSISSVFQSVRAARSAALKLFNIHSDCAHGFDVNKVSILCQPNEYAFNSCCPAVQSNKTT